MRKYNISIIIVLIILFIIGIGGFSIFLIKGMNKNNATIPDLSDDNVKPNQEQNVSKNGEPDGTAMKLTIKETKEESVNNGISKVDYVYIDDFAILIPNKLKEKGYKINLIANNRVLDITSNDSSYNCKIARFSSVNPYELTEQQDKELADLYEKLVIQECNKLGISKEYNNYYEIFYERHSKIDASNSNIIEFYNKYGINRYTRFMGFSNDEWENAWNILSTNTNELKWESTTTYEYVGLEKAKYKNNNMTAYSYEIDGNKNSFAGLFLQVETFNGSNSELYDYEIDLKNN